MSSSATVRVMSPEEIAARGGGETPYFHWPARESVFAEREMRLRQLASGHAMGDFLAFAAAIAHAQQARLRAFPEVPLPTSEELAKAAREGVPPLPASEWPRDPAWHGVLRGIVADLRPGAPEGAVPALERLAAADDGFLERQADCLLTGVTAGLDMACAPVVSAALQAYWVHLVDRTRQLPAGRSEPFGRIVDETACPCCGSRPVASITRSAGGSLGQRYLHCSLCETEWHMVRIKCPHCLDTASLAYQSLDAAGPGGEGTEGGEGGSRAAHSAIQAETCDACGHYLKIMHTDRDPFVEPVADDLASITLDLLVSEAGKLRHGVNLMLLFGPPEPPPDEAPPAPGGA